MSAKRCKDLPPKQVTLVESEAYWEKPKLDIGGRLEQKYGSWFRREPDKCQYYRMIFVVTRLWRGQW